MDIFLLISGFLLALLGIVGAFLPVLPGPITSWVGLLLLYLTSAVPMNSTFLIITLIVAIIIWLLDYLIPAMGTKRFGGTKYGVNGSIIGLILGMLFFPPLGIIIGPFLGAFIGELIKNPKDVKRALKAAIGSFIGFLTSTFLKFMAAFVYACFYVFIFFENIEAFF
ncbi:hypothetical protein SAMN06265371_10949 [Lutibacter agarilyticus]|uniref:DUF456 domain-containing protein n=1 Tax=Lutibacter agarilyticus TaxID=1109740 RepID=A0A238YGH6_9FLAO|nr:DUF456 domain-containing protein [Lutibacter agarilyticus]SNR70170.1 hypothetical protein SAMN06265371_10949 [Lutibacter agarilyticus]